MTEAYECDRCGELFAKPPAMRVATSESGVGGDIRVVERERPIGGGGPLTGGLSRERLAEDVTHTANINHGDLCEDCADELRDYWGEDDA